MDFQGFWKEDSVTAIRQELIWLIFHVQVASIALGYTKAGNILKVMLMMLCHLPSEQFILQMMWIKNRHHKTRKKMNNPLPGYLSTHQHNFRKNKKKVPILGR